MRVYEVLRALFEEVKENNPKKLLLTRDDLATRFSLQVSLAAKKGVLSGDDYACVYKNKQHATIIACLGSISS